MMELNINKKDKIHLIGIGGIGMSGIALILKEMGYDVQGSDISKNNKNITSLKNKKIKVFSSHKSQNIKNVKIVVISSAINKKNNELKYAISKNILVMKRADMLANIISLKKKRGYFWFSRKNYHYLSSFYNFKRSKLQTYYSQRRYH